MASVNKVILVGNLGRDPEVRSTPDGFNVANVSIATTFSWKDKNTGERRDETEWHRVVFYNRQAEIVGQYLKKGSAVYIEGRLRTRKYTGQDGIERYTTEIVAETMQMLGGRNGGDTAFPEASANTRSNDMGTYSQASSSTRSNASMNDGFSSPQQAAPRATSSAGTPATKTATRPAAPVVSDDFSDMGDDVPF